jgi:hypothetical protein
MVIKNIPVAVIAVFIALFATGIFVFKDYGISWDEPLQRKYGQDLYNYITKQDAKLLKNKDRYYGPTVELALITAEKISNPQTLKETYELRHLITFLLYFQGTVFFYLLCLHIFESKKYALLGTVMLIASPRIFAHSFYNSKDLPFMSLFITSTYFSLKFMKTPNWKNGAVAGLATALLVTTRIMGVLLPAITVTGMVLKKSSLDKKTLTSVAIFATTTLLATYALWPILWQHPVENFKEAFVQMSKYPQKTGMFYYGEKVSSVDLPWHYVPGNIAATTPLMYTVLFLVGILYAARGSIRKPSAKLLTIVGWFFIPLAAVILLKSVLYDSWRQLFFIYPPFIILAVYGLKSVGARRLKQLLTLALGINMAYVLIFMVKWHPHQNIYFSTVAGNDIEKHWELDYWGLSYKQALEYIEETYPEMETIKVSAKNFPGENNVNMLENSEKFVVVGSPGEADFYLTNYRGTAEKTFGDFTEVHSIKVNGYKIVGVYSTQ